MCFSTTFYAIPNPFQCIYFKNLATTLYRLFINIMPYCIRAKTETTKTRPQEAFVVVVKRSAVKLVFTLS